VHDLIGRRTVGRSTPHRRVQVYRVAHEDVQSLAAQAVEYSRQLSYVNG
jgi:hypothetical protein